jgi:Raf kinase inhibitor-like YbhB/YbcL family protein
MMELPEGAGEPGNGKLPSGAVQAQGDAGVSGYFGPCPPQGDPPHRYIFTIFAVKADRLDIDENTSGAVVHFNLHFNTISKASVTYTFGRCARFRNGLKGTPGLHRAVRML